MQHKRILTIQDISCVGQCSITVALPIISACGVETAILPSAVLSTHTGGFKDFTFRDLTDDVPKIAEHWQKEGITFDGIYTGYLGSAKQVDYVIDIINNALAKNSIKIVDPAMADNGKLYVGFDEKYVKAMKKLCMVADVVLPNITEACLLTETQYREKYDEEYIKDILAKLHSIFKGTIILTGVSYDDKYTGVIVSDGSEIKYYRHRLLQRTCHGTGDIYASSFTGALLNGFDCYSSACIAADFTVKAIECTDDYKNHWYGARFESAIPYLLQQLKRMV